MLAKSQANGVTPLDSQQIFPLIDSILPLEVCLHYQILPLCLKDNHLYLGMIDSQDESALEYVQKIVAYMNCSIVTQKISSEEHRSLLSAYLYHSQRSESSEPSPPAASKTEVKAPSNPPKDQVNNSRKQSPNVTPKTEELSVVSNKVNLHRSQATVGNLNSTSISSALSQSNHNLGSELPKTTVKTPPILEIKANHLTSSVEDLETLSPDEMLQELLARVLMGGIGRLYFERQENVGRILWSQDGVLQSVVTDLEHLTFQGIINELKRLVEIPFITVDKPRQVEIERLYQNQHLLLRLRITPGNYGEEANLQVLRGAALKFYQQQQLSKLSLDALRLTQQLQHKLGEISERLAVTPMSSENLVLLNQLLRSVTQQADLLLKQSQNYDSTL